jgi:hypothetical protein
VKKVLTRWWFWALLLIPCLGFAALIASFPLQESPETKFLRINKGMTRDQVAEAIGSKQPPQPCIIHNRDDGRALGWYIDDRLIIAHFDWDDMVDEKVLYASDQHKIIEHPSIGRIVSWFRYLLRADKA